MLTLITLVFGFGVVALLLASILMIYGRKDGVSGFDLFIVGATDPHKLHKSVRADLAPIVIGLIYIGLICCLVGMAASIIR